MNDATVIWSRRRPASALSEKVADLLLFLGLLLRLLCCCCGPLAAMPLLIVSHMCNECFITDVWSVQRYSAAYIHLKHDCEREHDCIVVRRVDGVAGYTCILISVYIFVYTRTFLVETRQCIKAQYSHKNAY